MNQKETVEVLRKAASEDKVFNDVAHMLADRGRSRHILTRVAMAYRMKREGFEHTRSEYSRVLKTLAKAGIGTPVPDKNGEPKALKDIKVTFESIGKAAVGDTASLTKWKARNRYVPLVAPGGPAPVSAQPPKPSVPAPKVEVPALPYTQPPVSIEIHINGKPVKVTLPDDMTSEELAGLIIRLRAKKPS